MVAAAAVVVLVVLGGGLMPAFSTVGSGSTAAADSASADAGDCTTDGGMQDEIEQSVRENADASSGGARIRVCSRAIRLRRVRTAAHTADRMTPAKTLRRMRRAMRASMPSSMQTASGRSQRLSRLLMSRYRHRCRPGPVLTLPQSLHGAHTAYCYVAVGGSSLPDIDGELLAQENGVSWFRLDNSMETLEKTLQTVEQAGCTVTAYDKVDLTIDSHADSWILAVVTG